MLITERVKANELERQNESLEAYGMVGVGEVN